MFGATFARKAALGAATGFVLGYAALRAVQAVRDLRRPYPSRAHAELDRGRRAQRYAAEQRMLMLQALLAERFKLAVHRETKELPIYTLVVGKGGPKFRAVEDDGSATEIGSGGGHQIQAHHVSMKSLAATLQGSVGDTVVDATGLIGLYDINLDFNVDESKPDEGPTVFEAVQRVGLKLEARKGPVEVVVIDHVEKPSAN